MNFINLKKIEPLSIITNHLIKYPTPLNITYFWSFGLLSAFLLGNQILTGIILAMHYNPSINGAFNSIEHIMRDVNFGWLLRNLHSNGASFFFFLVYIHIGRGFYYGSFSYPRMHLWASGVIIFILMMATAFLGYVLPWGQMSFWGATVITNLFTAFPVVGEIIAKWLWGGFSVGNPTLNKFFSLHYLLPFILLVIVILHIFLLHKNGSSNPLNFQSKDFMDFYPYFYIKDLFSIIILVFFFNFFITYMPNFLLHPDNYNIANSLNTPEHIVPEWYFLSFYAMLRAVPNKLGGVILMFGSLITVLIVPYIIYLIYFLFKKYFLFIINQKKIKNITFTFKFGFINRFIYTLFILSFIVLTYLGGQPIFIYYTWLSKICTLIFFFTLFYIIYISLFYVFQIKPFFKTCYKHYKFKIKYFFKELYLTIYFYFISRM